MSKKEYTFNNGKVNAHSAISHIDKFLDSQEPDTKEGRIEAAMSMRKLSDHFPFVIII
jgi:hypothetical protein